MAEHVIQVSADIGGLQISFARTANPAYDQDQKIGNASESDAWLDQVTKSIGRQRAKLTLAEKLVDLLANEKTLATIDEREQAALRSRAEEKVRLRLKWEAEHHAQGRRVDFAPNRQQKLALDQFDIETQKVRDKFNAEREQKARDIPVLDAQIARLRAVIAGGDPTDPLIPELAQQQALTSESEERAAEAA